MGRKDKEAREGGTLTAVGCVGNAAGVRDGWKYPAWGTEI